jgi:DNA-directed RNA polymerase specialized sigma24 family protein
LKTASMYVGIIERMDFEDVCQVLRVRVWKALEAWDPTNQKTRKRLRSGKSEEELRDAFVFGCVRNQVKDLLKRNPPRDLLIEDVAPDTEDVALRDRFELRYLTDDPDLIFREAEDSTPLVPNTLNRNERLVLACAYLGYNGPETAERIGIDKRRIASIMRSLREKMSDWRPSPSGGAATGEVPSGDPVRV